MPNEVRENTTINKSWSVVHPLSTEDSAATATLRSAGAPMKGKLAGIAARDPFNAIMERVGTPTASPLRATRSEASQAGGPYRRKFGKAQQSSTCTAAGSTGERP